MNRALQELNAQTWFAGLRREQSGSRANLPVLAIQRGILKCYRLLTGITARYISICKTGSEISPAVGSWLPVGGDTHTTRKWEPGMAEEETRFFGLKRECGLHEG